MQKLFELKHTQGVLTALELLLEEIEVLTEEISDNVRKVITKDDIKTLEKLLQHKFEIDQFRNTLKNLQKRWKWMWNGHGRKRKKKYRLPPGLCTPQKKFERPLLEALVELGGKAETKKVIDLVEKKMSQELNDYDRELLSCGEPRWRKSVQWCRFRLVKSGILSSNSSRGIWEITDQGRAYLESLKATKV